MIRRLHKTDINEILVIENLVHVSPWTEETFGICFEVGYVGWALEVDNKIVGFIIASMRKEECHVLNLCIAREYQHQGYGRQLLDYLSHQAQQEGVGIIYLEVRRSNTRAIRLYREMKFHLVGERKEYYPDPTGNEDALIFVKNLHEMI